MKKSDNLSVYDMIESIETVIYYLENCTLEELQNDNMRKDAVIRRYQVIGEAASKVSEKTKLQFQTFEWRKMKNFRNFLIHEYRKIIVDILYKTAKEILPTQLQYLKQIDLTKI